MPVQAITGLNQPDKIEFCFPFKPYDIQEKLMRMAYETINNAKFGLLESPTGTGKSLSLICSSLKWLRDYQAKRKQQVLEFIETTQLELNRLKQLEDDETEDWLKLQLQGKEISDKLDCFKAELTKIEQVELKNQSRRSNKLNYIQQAEEHAYKSNFDTNTGKKRKLSEDFHSADASKDNIADDELDLIVDLPDSIDESALNDSLEFEEDEDKQEQQLPKIYYASRTHSQLSQFVNEVKRTQFAKIENGPVVKVVALASRANLCVNPCVAKLKDSNAINERCTELQREKKVQQRCPYLQKGNVQRLKDDILAQVQDIEEITTRGRNVGACPYYAARAAIPEAELVILPYNSLFHPETRAASSLTLQQSVVLVDEAHNILDTICSIHSSQIKGSQLIEAHSMLSRYYARYHSRLSPFNAESIKNIVHCLTTLIRYMKSPVKLVEIMPGISVSENETSQKSSVAPETICKASMVSVINFITSAKIEEFNIFKIVNYFKQSQLARKLLGFSKIASGHDYTINIADLGVDGNTKATKVTGTKAFLSKMLSSKLGPPKKRQKKTESKDNNIKKVERKSSTINSQRSNGSSSLNLSLSFLGDTRENQNYHMSYPIYSVIEFFRSLTNFMEDGRILIHPDTKNINESVIKFLLINPSNQFREMVEQARSIILAGGTMQPFDEYVDLLFTPLNINKERLTLFSCGHVIPSQNLFVGTLAQGPTSKQFDLSYRTRSKPEILEELGRTIANISMIVPGGLVCFFPSYDYEQLCYDRWSSLGILKTIEARSRQVFREPKTSNLLQSVLNEYTNCIENGRGALLLSVVGGKMSEGINFNDNLGRCVVMIGMPYANVKSVELQEKMRFYDINSCVPKAGQMYYENLCLKGINQSIGRAIRHQNDYAAILLIDQRYQTKQTIRSGLPQWIGSSLKDYDRFGSLFANLKQFYDTIQKKPVD